MPHAVSNYNCKNFVCIDFETSSLSTNTAEIIEIGAVKVADGEVIDCYNTAVKLVGMLVQTGNYTKKATDDTVGDIA